jgi:predicted RNA binding protein YcfA (HicA-like mRNA interferase family)
MPISGKEMLRRFLANGREVLRQNGSHVVLGKGSLRETIPVHGNQDLKKGLERKLLKRLKG